MSSDDRKSPENGIWLCQTHAKLIDNDPERYSVELLRTWKYGAEERAREEIEGSGRSNPALVPIFMLPYPRNPYFTGREDLLRDLAAALAVDGAAAVGQVEIAQVPRRERTAISGLGGIGKTQAVIEYAYRHRDAYRAVFFVRAETEADVVSGYAAIARELGLAEAADQDQAVAVAAVRRWLGQNDGWLLLLDNADNPTVVKSFLPASSRGHVVVTSRAPSLAVLAIRAPLRMTTLPPEEAVAFLFARAGRHKLDKDEQEAALALASELGFLPLALEQAGAYLVEHQDTFTAYLESYRSRGVKLLARSLPQVDGHPDPVATTWTLNFREVEAASPSAADVLRTSAFLAPDDIPDELLIEGGAELGPAISVALDGDPLAVGELLGPLLRYSLVQRDVACRTWSVHRVVQEVVKESLGGEGQSEWAKRAVKALRRVFPWPEFPTWPKCERLLAHVLEAALTADESLEAAWLLGAAGSYLDDRARYTEAEPLYLRSLAMREKLLGATDPEVAKSLHNLAVLYRSQGRFSEAEPLCLRALAITETVLGNAHPDVATHLSEIAVGYALQGRLHEAEPLFARSLAIRETVLGDTHPDVARSLNNLAETYNRGGRLAEAEKLFVRALAIRESTLSDMHPLIAQSLHNLAEVYEKQGRLHDAELLGKRSLMIYEKALGGTHPDVADSLNNLAIICRKQGSLAEAELLHERAFMIREIVFGAAHPDVAVSLNNLACLCEVQGRLPEAETFFERALTIFAQALGETHPYFASSLSGLAKLYVRQGRLAEAEPLYVRSLEILDKVFGGAHPDIIESLEGYALLLRQAGRDAQAEKLEARARAASGAVGGAELEDDNV